MREPAAVLVLAVQLGVLATFIEGLRRRNVAAAVNSLVALALALLPAIVEFALRTIPRSVAFGPELPLWIAVAGLLHSLGMLGLYDSRWWWWDHVTHTVSAALVAALFYAGAIVARQTAGFEAGPIGVAGVTVLFTFAVGVFWELIELVAREVGKRYDIEPVLVHYGRRDTAFDLGFDVVGALLVVAVDLRLFVPVASQFSETMPGIVLRSGGTVLAGTVLLTLLLGYLHVVE